jgi:hypothetical protein
LAKIQRKPDEGNPRTGVHWLNTYLMTKHILLIEDDEDDAEIFAEALTQLSFGAILHHYDDGFKALESLEKQQEERPDIIFRDVNMPDIDGWDGGDPDQLNVKPICRLVPMEAGKLLPKRAGRDIENQSSTSLVRA